MNEDNVSTTTNTEEDIENDSISYFSQVEANLNNTLIDDELPYFNNIQQNNFSYFDSSTYNTMSPLSNNSNLFNNNLIFDISNDYLNLNLSVNTLSNSNSTTNLNSYLFTNNSSFMNISENVTTVHNNFNTSNLNNYLFTNNSNYNSENVTSTENNLNNNFESITEQSSEDINTDYNNSNEYDTLLSNDSMNVLDGSNNHQYSLLHDTEDANNPFYKCNIEQFSYDTDEEDNDDIRVILSWYYEFNYDYFNINDINVCISKGEYFKSVLNKFKVQKSNLVNKIIKLNNESLKRNEDIFLYLIVYYDNAKVNIDFYGIFNQQICEEKLLDNIKKENIYGKNGIISKDTYLNNLAENDFIILSKNLKII